MKGTLFSSDFIIDESDNLRLLEFNTDTGFLSSTLDSKFDFTAFINILSTNDITKLWIIHKGFQENFVEILEQVIAIDPGFITETGLQGSLTPSRSNGFLNIFLKMNAQAKLFL